MSDQSMAPHLALETLLQTRGAEASHGGALDGADIQRHLLAQSCFSKVKIDDTGPYSNVLCVVCCVSSHVAV